MADATEGSMSSLATFWRRLPFSEIPLAGDCDESAASDSLVESTFGGEENSEILGGEFSGGTDDSASLAFCATGGNDSALRVCEMMLKKSSPPCAGPAANPPGNGDGSISAAAGSTGGKSDFVIIWRYCCGRWRAGDVRTRRTRVWTQPRPFWQTPPKRRRCRPPSCTP